MEKEFKSTKHILFQVIFFWIPILLSIALVFILIINFQSWLDDIGKLLLKAGLILTTIFILWQIVRSFQHTIYKISKDRLEYKCGINKGAIHINEIRSIKHAKYPSVGNRPALDFDGLEITYGEGYTVFLSPESKSRIYKVA